MKSALHPLSRAHRTSPPGWALLFLAAIVLSPTFVEAADVASLTVAVRQMNPDSAATTVACTLLQKQCNLQLVINAGTEAQESVTIQVVYHRGGLALNFKTDGGYFYTSSAIGNDVVYHTLWSAPLRGGVSNYTVNLFQPLTPNLIGPGSTSTTPHTSVAKLEITATTAP
jgi:hypothetical protein